MDVFWRLHEDLPKQGPGSDRTTRRALACVPALPTSPRILDLGCGPGRQTLVLARETGGHVTAVDLVPRFLAQLIDRAAELGLSDRVTPLERSMTTLGPPDQPDGHFDLLWSEGALYNIGFEAGLRRWRRLLRPGGCVAVTELAWLSDARPSHVAEFWRDAHPDMADVATHRRAIDAAGYRLIEDFVVPEADWWDDYYTPISARARTLRAERADPEWQAALDEAEQEIRVFRDAAGSYGYVFYVMQRPATD